MQNLQSSLSMATRSIACTMLLFCSSIYCPLALAQSRQWNVKEIYRSIESNPELRGMAVNNCMIWRRRNRNENRSYYKDTSGFEGMIIGGYAPNQAIAVSAAVAMWTKRNCPDIW